MRCKLCYRGEVTEWRDELGRLWRQCSFCHTRYIAQWSNIPPSVDGVATETDQ